MSPYSFKAKIVSIVDQAITIALEDGQSLMLHPSEISKLSVGQNVWVTVSDGPFDPTQQPKEILNTVFGN